MSARWYKRCGADFIHGTMMLSLEEKGAYSLCLDLIYDRGAPIPDDARWLSGVCGVSIRKWNSIRDRLLSLGKIYAENGLLSNARADFELVSTELSSRERAESGAKGGRKRAENAGQTLKNNDLAQAEPKREEKIREEVEDPPTPRAGGRDRGSKIPEDWVPPVVADLSPQAKGCAEQWTGASYAAEAEAFRNYWIGESSSRARKSNWGTAWANRVVQVHGRVMKDQKFGHAPTGSHGPAVPMNDNDWNDYCDRCAERARLMNRHDEAADWIGKKRGPGPERSRKPQAVGDLVGRMAVGAQH
jgi:uncharacterized protein YdaU (DUF1376 family)